MKVLILAGGYGTRLYPLVKDTAKALLKVNDKPLIDYSLAKIKNLKDLNEVIIVTNEKFYNDFCTWSQCHPIFPCKIRVVNDHTSTPEERLGSIGDIDFVLEKDSVKEDLLVLGGDNIFDFSIEKFISESKDNSPNVTIGLYDIDDKSKASNFGVVALNEKKVLSSFEEKPDIPKSSLVAMCLYYFPLESLIFIKRYIKESQKADAAGGYIRWLSQHQDVYGFRFTGMWYDIGSIESYENAQKDFRL